MRCNSEKGVPRGSKNGSGAIIRMCIPTLPDRVGLALLDRRVLLCAALALDAFMTITPEPVVVLDSDAPRAGRHRILWLVQIVVSAGLLYVLLSRVDLARLWTTPRPASLP